MPSGYITDDSELRQLTAFFAWTAWASIAARPGTSASYTNNFPYEPEAGNTPTGQSLLWSDLSLIALLGGIAGVLFVFGKFDYLEWLQLPGDLVFIVLGVVPMTIAALRCYLARCAEDGLAATPKSAHRI